jgi:biopolymer transport protein ExbD
VSASVSVSVSVKALAVFASLGLAACSGADTREPETAGDVGQVPLVAADGGRNPAAALDACRAALDRATAAPVDARYALVAEGCADLYSMPVCGEAIRMSPAARPPLRPLMIAVACQHAYCPILEAGGEPPALCGMRPASMSASELREPWGDFARAVLALELGLDAGAPELAALAAALPLAPVEAVPVEPAARPTLVVDVSREGSGYRVAAETCGEAFGPWTLPLEPDESDFAGLLEAAARRAAGGRAVLRAAHDVVYVVVIHLIDALRGLEITEVALESDASDLLPAAPE